MADDQDEGLTFAAPGAPTQTSDAGEGLTFADPPRPQEGPPQPLWSKAVGVAEDVGKGAVAGGMRGLFGLAGAPGSVERTLTQDVPMLARNLGYDLGKRMDIYSPAEAESLKQQPLSWIGYNQSPEASEGRVAPLTGLPTYKGVVEDIKAGKPQYGTLPFGTYEPSTPLGKVAGATTEGAAQAILGGIETIAPRMVQGALAGGGSEAASELTGGNPYWTIAGGLVGGGVGSGLGHLVSDKNSLARGELDKMVADAARRGASNVTPEQFNEAMQNGVPLSVFHLLDPQTQKTVAKYAGMSDEAQATVNKFNSELQAAQAAGNDRLTSFFQNMFGSPLAAPKIEDMSKDLANAERDRVFSLARANPKADAIPNTVIGQDLLDHPLFKDAMKNASDNAPILSGFNLVPPVNIPGTPGKWVQTPRGLVQQPGTPAQFNPANMNYWQEVKEQLDGMHSAAERSGDNKLAATIDTLRGNLKTRVGAFVPEYGDALKAARDSYIMQDATRAGYFFAKSPDQFKINDIQKIASGYNAEQNSLFQQGVAAYINDIASKPNGVEALVKNFGSNRDFQDRIKTALGDQNYYAMKSKVMSEDLFRNADAMKIAQPSGKSLPIGVGNIGSIGAIGGAATDVLSAHPEILHNVGAGTITGGAVAIAAYGASKVLNYEQRRIADKLIPMLASNDPKDLARVGEILDKNWRAQSAINTVSNALRNAAGATIGRAIRVGVSPTGRVLQTAHQPEANASGGRTERASGGRIMDHDAEADRLVRAADMAKNSVNKTTEKLLDVPDEAIIKALDVAQQAI